MSKPGIRANSRPVDDDIAFLGERREISALSYDLIGSTNLLVETDIEDFGGIISRFQDRTAKVIRANRGFVREALGDDGGMAFFGYPESIEESAKAAIQAAFDIVEVCRPLSIGGRRLQVRVGVATAEVVISRTNAGAGPAIVGLAPNIAARLQSLAPANEVLVSDRTRKLAGRHFTFLSFGKHQMKGLDAEQTVWEVKWRTPTTRFFSLGRLTTQIFGRHKELVQALSLWRLAVQGFGQTLIVEGEPGVGKSRFVLELLKGTRGARARLFILQCSALAIDSALEPIRNALRADNVRHDEDRGFLTAGNVASSLQRTGMGDQEAAQAIAFAIGAGAGEDDAQAVDLKTNRDRLTSAIFQCVDTWIRAGPLVIVVEDIHWIDPSSQALLAAVALHLQTKPALLLLTSRTDPRWLTGDKVRRLRLKPLQSGDAARLASEIWLRQNGSGLSHRSVQRLFQRTRGVPLLLEETLQWIGSKSAASPDPFASLTSARSFSFEAMLSTRLGALGPAKHIAQAAAVIGNEFDQALLAAVVPKMSESDLARALGELVNANILRRREGAARGRWSFRHALFQEVLYASLLRVDRLALHARIFAAASCDGTGSIVDPAALGRHAEAAGLHLEAAYAFIKAAKGSFARSAAVEACSLLRQAQTMHERLFQREDRDRLFLATVAALGPLLISLEGNRSAEACRLYDEAVLIARTRPKGEVAWQIRTLG